MFANANKQLRLGDWLLEDIETVCVWNSQWQ